MREINFFEHSSLTATHRRRHVTWHAFMCFSFDSSFFSHFTHNCVQTQNNANIGMIIGQVPDPNDTGRRYLTESGNPLSPELQAKIDFIHEKFERQYYGEDSIVYQQRFLQDGNMTNMTAEERTTLGLWIRQGAPLD